MYLYLSLSKFRANIIFIKLLNYELIYEFIKLLNLKIPMKLSK